MAKAAEIEYPVEFDEGTTKYRILPADNAPSGDDSNDYSAFRLLRLDPNPAHTDKEATFVEPFIPVEIARPVVETPTTAAGLIDSIKALGILL